MIQKPPMTCCSIALDTEYLTRDRELAARAVKRKVYFVNKIGAEYQMEEIRGQFPLQNAHPRCLVCNHPIQRIAKDKVSHLVPPFVYRTQQQFFRCRHCNRIYWKGTHFERLSRVIQFRSKAKSPVF